MNRQIIKMGMLILLGSFVLFPGSWNRQACGQPILVVAETDWPPYFFAGKPNTPEGFGKELLEMIFSEMGYNLKFEFYPVNRMYSYLEDGKIDICVFSHNKEREDRDSHTHEWSAGDERTSVEY